MLILRSRVLRQRKYFIFSIFITFCLLILHLKEETSSERRDSPVLPEEPEKPELSPELFNIVSPADYDQSGCPRVPISFSAMTGRLGNIISTYVNFIALEWKLGYKYPLPQHTDSSPDAWLTKSYLQTIFRNVSFPTANWSNWTKPRPRDAGPTGVMLISEHGRHIKNMEHSVDILYHIYRGIDLKLGRPAWFELFSSIQSKNQKLIIIYI